MEMNPVDLLMWAGEKHYTVSEFIREAQQMGVSKRISKTSIPEGVVSGKSKLLIKHRYAIVSGNDLEDLIETLAITRAMPEYTLPDDMLPFVITLENIRENDLTFWNELVDRYELVWSPGVIGYTTITGVQYVAHEHEDGLPEELQHMDNLIEPVRVVPE